MCGYGTLKEDGPVTREAHVVLWRNPGNGEPVTHSDAPLEANGPVAGIAVYRDAQNERSPTSKAHRGQTGGALMRQGSRMAAYER